MRTLGVAVVGAALLAGACAPHSIADAVSRRNDEFPANSYVLVPPANLNRLGETIEVLGSRRARATGTKCFDVVPVAGEGLSKIELSYKAGQEFQAEVKTLAAKAGGELKNDDTATIVLDGLKVIEGIGIPNRNSACGFRDGDNVAEVITATVVAASATIEFSRNIAFKASGSGGWSSGSGMGSGGASASASQSGKLQGRDIVIAAAVTPVKVSFARKQEDLGAAPAPGTVVSFPDGYDGNVRVDALLTATPDQVPVLTVTPNTIMNAELQNLPPTLKACTPGASTALKPGAGCFVWDRAGAAGVNIWFEVRDSGSGRHVIVHTDGYRTTFSTKRRS